jgi:hypothetical protein
MIHELPIPQMHAIPIHHNEYSFLRLSMVKLLPRAADQAKKATLKKP